jgi:predicted nucleotidyltransferase
VHNILADFSVEIKKAKIYYDCKVRYFSGVYLMVRTKQKALEIAAKVRAELDKLYGPRLRGVLLFGSAARGKLDEDSDIDVAIILDQIPDRFAEHERTSEIGSQLSLEYDTLVSFFFVPQPDYEQGKYAAYRAIKREGIPV